VLAFVIAHIDVAEAIEDVEALAKATCDPHLQVLGILMS
jgi:hypothetical protein